MLNPLDTAPLVGFNAYQYIQQQDGAVPPFLAICDDDTAITALGGPFYYGAAGADITQSSGSPATDRLQYVPFWSRCGGILSEIAFFLVANGTAGSVARCGLYNADQKTLLPTTLVVDGGQQATDAGGPNVLKTTTLNPLITLLPNTLYYTAFVCGTASPSVATYGSGWHPLGRSGTTSNSIFGLQRTSFTYAALPVVAPAATALMTSTPCQVQVRYKSLFRP